MENRIKKTYSNEFKFRVAFAALKGDKTTAALCKEFNLHEGVIHKWKKILKDRGTSLFDKNASSSSDHELKQRLKEINECFGELALENRFLKKNLNL